MLSCDITSAILSTDYVRTRADIVRRKNINLKERIKATWQFWKVLNG
jgi:hypothetical protein